MRTSVTRMPKAVNPDLNKSWVKGREAFIFSISMAMACASAPPITMGNLRFPDTSPKTGSTGPTNLVAAGANSGMGGFGADKINGASYPYNDYPVTLLAVADATATTSYLTYSSKQRLTITRTAADFPVAWPMSLSFRVNTAAASPEYIAFAKSKVWWKRIDV